MLFHVELLLFGTTATERSESPQQQQHTAECLPPVSQLLSHGNADGPY